MTNLEQYKQNIQIISEVIGFVRASHNQPNANTVSYLTLRLQNLLDRAFETYNEEIGQEL